MSAPKDGRHWIWSLNIDERRWSVFGRERMNPDDERLAALAATLVGAELVIRPVWDNPWDTGEPDGYRYGVFSDSTCYFKRVLWALHQKTPYIWFEHYRFEASEELPHSGPPDEFDTRLKFYNRTRPYFKPHPRGGKTYCYVYFYPNMMDDTGPPISAVGPHAGLSRCSFTDDFEYAEGRSWAFDDALAAIREYTKLDGVVEGVCRWADRVVEQAQERGRERLDYDLQKHPEVATAVDKARDEPSERKSVMFAVDEDGSAYPGEIFDEGISVQLDDEAIERIREAMEKRDIAEGKIYLLGDEVEVDWDIYRFLYDQFRELFNEYLLSIDMHPAEEEYVQENPHIPFWLSGYVRKVTGGSPGRALNYWPLKTRAKSVQKIEELVRENADVLGVDDVPAGRLWLDLAYELLQGLVETNKVLRSFVRERP